MCGTDFQAVILSSIRMGKMPKPRFFNGLLSPRTFLCFLRFLLFNVCLT
jgi:hypothetical protein